MDEAGITAAIAEVTPQLPIGAKDLVERARPPVSLDLLRDDLGIGFKEFNQALAALGPPYTLRRYPERHDDVFAAFIDGRREVILDRLRETFLDASRAGSVPDVYLNARELEGLEPDPAWVDEYAEPPGHVMAAQVQMWLADVGAGTDLADPGLLEPLEFVRAENFQRLQQAVARAEKVILTWCHKHQVTAPQAWTSAQVGARTNLERSGLADFEAIAENRLFSMLTALGWPDAMPQTIDLDELGLSEEELQSREDLEAAARQRTQQRAKTIPLNGRDVPVTVADYGTIAAAAVEAVSEALVKQTGKAKLSPIDAPVRKARGHRGHTVVARDPGMTEDQARAVGLVGEVFAKAWLEHRYPTAQVEWRSGYRAIVMGDDQGSDSLGYDFEVIRRGSTLLYEVKATAGEVHGDILQFSLSEGELDQAQANARNDRYRLLLVLGVLVQGETTVLELPNPRAAASRGLFAVVGSGLTYNCVPGR